MLNNFIGPERFGISKIIDVFSVHFPEKRNQAEIDYLAEGLTGLPLKQSERVIAELIYMKADTDGSRQPEEAPDLKMGNY